MRAIKILFVEDLATDVELAQRELKREKIEFSARVVDTEKGMRKELAEFQPDLIISDYSMPRFDGMSALKIARFEPNNIPFIMLTGSMNEETAVACMKAGADDYVLKEKIRRLPFAVREVMDKRTAQEEKERLLRQIHASEKRFRTIMSSMQDIVFTLDREQRHTAVYGPWVEQQGMTPEDFLGKTAREIMGAANATVHEEANTKALEGEFVVYEWSAETEQGTRYYQTSLSPIVDDSGEVSGLVGVGRDITQIKLAEAALRESERNSTFLAQTTFELVELSSIEDIYKYTVNQLYELLEGNSIVALVEYNHAENRWKMQQIEGVGTKTTELSRLFGFDIHNLEGEISKKFSEKITSNKLVELEFDFPTLFNNKVSVAVEKAVRKMFSIEKMYCIAFEKDKQIIGNITITTNKKSKPLNTNLIESFVLQISNFVKKQKSEAALRESEEKLRSYIDFAPDGVFITDENGRYIEVNPAACKITGYTEKELLKKIFSEMLQNEYREKGLQHFSEMKDQGFACGDLGYLTKTGENRFWNVAAVKLSDTRFLGFAKDITERKQAEKTLQEMLNRWQTTFDAISDIVCVISKDFKIEAINSTGVASLGLSREEIVGRKCFELVHKTNSPIAVCPCQKTLNTGEPETGEYEQDGRSYILHAWPIRDQSGNTTSFVHIIKDITGQKQILADKETLEAQLNQSQKLESVGTLASGVAHDFNNLLTVIMGHAQMGLMNTDEDDPLNRSLKQILTASTSAANLTRQLLLFSRKEVMEFKPVNINQTIQNLLKMLGRLIGENIKIEMSLESDVWMIEADEGNLEQVLTNLAVNARDAMPDGGKLTIQTENVQITEADKKHILNAEVGNYVRIGISDNGKGIPEDIRDKIFDPFFTTKASGRGTGLGLSVVYGIVKKHGGWINVSSEVGKGARFTIYLPATGKMAQSDDKEAIPDFESLQGNGERVLLIEDEESVLEFTLNALRQYEYKVFPVSTGKEARTVFEQESGKFDLIFSDVILPDTNGYELVKNLTGGKTDIPIILSSGYTDERVREQIGQDSSITFIQKPYSIFKMLEMVKIALQKSQIN